MDRENELCVGHAVAVQAPNNDALRLDDLVEVICGSQLLRVSEDLEKVCSALYRNPWILFVMLNYLVYRYDKVTYSEVGDQRF
jgi:hypothetical protein